LDEYIEENVEVEEETVGETDTKPSKCNYCILKEMEKYISTQVQYSYTLRMGS
jgi:hypothetical protein